MTTQPRRRWTVRRLLGAWLDGRREEDSHVRRAAAGAAKMGALGIIALVAVRALAGALTAMPDRVEAAIARESAERRGQHAEQLARLDRIADGLAARAGWEALMEGAVRGRCPECRPPRCPAIPPCPPCPSCAPQSTSAPPASMPPRPGGGFPFHPR